MTVRREDTKEVIRIHKSKDRQHNGQKMKDRQHNGQKKKDKTTIYKTLQKTEDRATLTPLKTGCELGCSGRVAVHAPLVAI